ncbi:hypothetical protein GGQ92_003258 [Gracilibacillus halotolerans]|uniref:Uncharacterized protein n=1 Tax=Gracilibacillus halotolerans TaxID=74386 RepID=A0A841RRH6_9BACI|nr:DUF6526 family protein [Gracilibacillus halotolerans]MBB6514422.1 hypothetical protein [Gracilibacillus halotolerans]
MKEQSYENHTRYQPLQHFVWLPLSFLLLIETVVYAVIEFINYGFSLHLLLLVGVVILAIIPGMLARIYAITLQDRLIQNEEQLRYFMLAGKGLDNRLTKEQMIALRFASDTEFVELVNRTIEENLSPEDIKKSIKIWRPDHHRV